MNTADNPQKILPLTSLSRLEFLLRVKRGELRKMAGASGQYYNPYDLHKKGTNKWRHIDNPRYVLKSIQKRVLEKILNQGTHQLPEGMMGGISGKSIVDNARIHIKKDCIALIDIKDCFPSTKHLRIYQAWRDYFGCGEKTIGILTQLTTFQRRLPQGAPTSPLLCNFALVPVFKEIKKHTIKYNLDISIFIDDITISGKKEDVIKAIHPIIKILLKHKYSPRKTNLVSFIV